MSAELAPTGVTTLNGDATADPEPRSGGAFDATAAGVANVPADLALTDLRRQARELLAELAGPIRRIRLGSGDAVLEVEWHAVGDGGQPPAHPVLAAPPVVPAHPLLAAQPVVPVQPAAVPTARHAVRSPIVGTFYRAPEPGAAPFVAVGDRVHPGQVVGIVEAMKLMNEVTADRAGRIAEVLTDDGQPVEYDQPLLAVDPI
ncbi:acetyl-CoA carboxylase biotin carboxyl carrier protein [Salinispora sp. H7-4]|uniref:acetyl-CoA carboxylase biotin carboxyl carrier protein n=1 Tax=Salinispora sp. H7-4 TaxID=2748321 RepID=UPI0015D10BFC|nr:acetyl-CoA carboxylase biotin carboxyl carrier protein [Salinispora sp. H7-4]NYT93260.1 acetyl-CoA carboxylase biotin carboxyl carrier protein [Salinispora sp. H7-4]